MPLPTDPIALTITFRDERMADVLLSYPVKMEDQDNITMLSLGDDATKIKVPEKCIDFLAVTIYQLEVFRRTADVLMDRPDTPIHDTNIQFYLALISYTAAVITAFIQEVDEDGAKATQSKWRSARLDYHIALSLENSAFTTTHQRIAEQRMKRTWAQFREKKVYKRIQSMTLQRLHEALCSDGDDACGGPFEHKRSIDEVVAAAIANIDTMRATAASTSVAEPAGIDATHISTVAVDVTKPAVLDVDAANTHTEATAVATPTAIDGGSEKPFEVCITHRPQVKATATTRGHASSTKSQKSKQSGEDVRRKATIQAAGPSQYTLDAESEDEVDHSERIATVFERLEVAKKPVKARKAKKRAPVKQGKGKGKATPQILVVDSSDEISDVSSSDETFPSAILSVHSIGGEDDPPSPAPTPVRWRTDLGDDIPNIRSGVRPFDRGGLNDDPLPSVLADWDTWHRTAFERGNSQVFLKLATWMLLRFRQLSTTDMNADVNGVIIPLNPRTMPFADDDDFLEALGMERLYSAIVHMETRPRFLSHLFHALGSLANDADIGHSNHGSWPIASPPPVTPSMMSDVDIPWLYLSNDDRDVSHTSHTMDVADVDLPASTVSNRGVETSSKRKRTLSLASPPKAAGGRGPSKRHKEGIPVPVGRSGTTVTFISRPPTDHLSPGRSASPVDPSDALIDDATIGQPLGDTPQGHEAAVEPIDTDPAGDDFVHADSVLPTPTQIIVISETTSSGADVSVQLSSASDVNN